MNDIKGIIKDLLPDVKEALINQDGDYVNIGHVSVSRQEAELICNEFEKELKSRTKKSKISWDTIPLKLTVADKKWRQLQRLINDL